MSYFIHNTANASQTLNGAECFLYKTHYTYHLTQTPGRVRSRENTIPGSRDKEFVNPVADYLMASGQIPDLRGVCMSILRAYNQIKVLYSAKQFAGEIQQVPVLDQEQVKRFIHATAVKIF